LQNARISSLPEINPKLQKGFAAEIAELVDPYILFFFYRCYRESDIPL
jgi:hypothetical protein